MSGERLVVTRGRDRDTVSWEPPNRGQTPATPPREPPRPMGPIHVGPGKPPTMLIGMLIATLILGAIAGWLRPGPPKPVERVLLATIADLSPVHAGVTARGGPVRTLTRLALGDTLETDADGRARLRLDTGATLVVDGGTKITLTEKGVELGAGRAFLLGGTDSPLIVGMGKGELRVVGAAVGLERREATRAYVAQGELSAMADGKTLAVQTGETATFDGKLVVKPERGYDDWTGGLAAPWAADGPPRRALGELWGRSQPGETGSALTIRTHEVRAQVFGEVAETRVRTTFFNAGELTVAGDFRMGLPKRAVISAFAVTRGDQRRPGRITLANRGGFATFEMFAQAGFGEVLEWAGDGWIRGTVPQIAPGQSVTIEIAYVEWLPVRPEGDGFVVQYRYPLVGGGEPPRVGEFFASVDAGPANPRAVAAGMGARADGATVEVRRADFRPTADFVVDVELDRPLAPARAFVAEPLVAGEESTIVVRTELPRLEGSAEEGVTLAVVLDTSASIDPALFDAARATVEALVKSLGKKDRIIVLAADAQTRAVGPEDVGPADGARRTAILDGLATLSPGGATDLGRALEAAADRLPKDAPSAMLVYIGDGWPSVGDRTAEAMRARLSRRARGVPRIGAVLVGPSTNRRALSALARGSGPVIEVGDSEDAARASVELLESALVPTVTGVTVDLGPDVARVYPRDEVALPQGSTLMVVGKLAADPPTEIRLSYRVGEEKRSEKRAVALELAPSADDVRRRWAEARVLSMALAGSGREAITDAALGAGLLTPWTAWTTGGTPEYMATALDTRVLDLSAEGEPGMSVALITEEASLGALAGEADVVSPGWQTLEQSLALAAVRAVDQASGQLRACRDSRAALRPDLAGSISIDFELDGEGKATNVNVTGAVDDALARCISTVVESIAYPRLLIEGKVAVQHRLVLPPIGSLRGKKCSPTSTLPVPLRRGVWRERFNQMAPAAAYEVARQGCELSTWTAKRSLLALVFDTLPNAISRLDAAQGIEDAGDLEAAAFLRKEVLRRAAPEEMRAVRLRLLAREHLPIAAFTERYEKAADDAGRLAVVRSFLELAPHDARLRSRLVAILAALGDAPTLTEEVRRLRADPFADAVLLADAAHALHVVKLDDEARRTYGEIAERASTDPSAQALLGDRLRGEQWFEDATAAYEALDDLAPGDGPSSMRLALAHVGAGRLDVALRILGRVARTGGRSGQADVANLAERIERILIGETLARTEIPAGDRRLLERSLAELGAPPQGVLFVLRTPPGRTPVSAWVERGPDKAREFVPPEATAGRLGVLSLLVPPGDQEGTLLLSVGRSKSLPPEDPFVVRIAALDGDHRFDTEITLPGNGDRVDLAYEGGTLTVKKRAEKPAAPPAR